MVAVADAALGAAFGELLRFILDVGERALMFKSILDDIKSKLERIIPLLQEIEELNESSDSSKLKETETLRKKVDKAKKLIDKCCKIKWAKINFVSKSQYTKRLRDLDGSLNGFMLEILLQTSRDGKKTLKTVTGIDERLVKMEGDGMIGMKQMRFITIYAVPELRDEPVGLDVAVEELKLKLLKNGVSMVVVTAPGGCGKTTLAQKFCKDNDVKDTFQENIFFIPVSRTRRPDLKLIIENIFQCKYLEAPEFQNDDIATNCLEQLVKQISPSLFVLDDVSSESEPFLDKFNFRIDGCKILVTSRFKFPSPRYGDPYEMKTLNDSHAIDLFRRSASLSNATSNIPDVLVEKIVRGCKSFPLAITIAGRSLCGRPAAVWRDTEKKWSRGRSFFDSDTELLNCLQSSLDISDDEVSIKDSFMDVGSFPEDQRIPATSFIDMFSALYELDEDGAITTLEKLADRNLVNPVTTRKDPAGDDYYNEHFYTQHDALRELAIHWSGLDSIQERTRLVLEIIGNDFPNWWSEQYNNSPISARLLSISTDERFSSCWLNLQAPEVEVVILNLRTENYSLPEFMKRMNKLKVLIITNYSFVPTRFTNYQLLSSLSTLERIRLERISFPSLIDTTLQLPNLRKISLCMCSVSRAFSNHSFEISNVMPNLQEISIDFCNDLEELPAGFSNLVGLEKLSITNCHNLVYLPEGIGHLVNLHVLRLTSCTDLIELPESVSSLINLTTLDISNCLSITNLPEKFGDLQNLTKLHMKSCLSLDNLPFSLRNLRNLKDVVCEGKTARRLKLVAPNLANLINEPEEDISLDFLNIFV